MTREEQLAKLPELANELEGAWTADMIRVLAKYHALMPDLPRGIITGAVLATWGIVARSILIQHAKTHQGDNVSQVAMCMIHALADTWEDIAMATTVKEEVLRDAGRQAPPSSQN